MLNLTLGLSAVQVGFTIDDSRMAIHDWLFRAGFRYWCS
jgi:hypothetical protein